MYLEAGGDEASQGMSVAAAVEKWLQGHEGSKVWAFVSGLTRVSCPSLEPDLGLVDL